MIRLIYAPEDDTHGELTVEASYNGFSGKASAWFNAEALRSFHTQILAHPDREAPAATLKGGYFCDSSESYTPVETHISIIVTTHRTRGMVLVDTYLADQLNLKFPQSAAIQFLVAPAALHRFAQSLNGLLDGLSETTLTASPDIF
jgi:hypothetical protein